MQRTLVLLRECGGRATFAILVAVIAVVHANDEPRQRTTRSTACCSSTVSGQTTWVRMHRVLEQPGTRSRLCRRSVSDLQGQRALAMMHLAMHDALNAIVPIYETYAYRRYGLAHPIAAASQAAHDVLVAQHPDQRPKLIEHHAGWLANVPEGSLRDRGIELAMAPRLRSSRVAAKRLGFPGRVRVWTRCRPLSDDSTMERLRRPTRISIRGTVRPRIPRTVPAVTSTAVEKQAIRAHSGEGARRSRQRGRTDDQTAYAIWWMEFAEGSEIAWRGNLPPIVTCISGELPVCSLMWPWRSSTHTWRHGTRSASTITGVRAQLFGLHERPEPNDSGSQLGAAASNTAVSRIHVGSRGCLRRLFGVLAGSRSSVVHDGDHDRPTRHAQANVCELPRSGRRVCGFTSASGVAFPCSRGRGTRAGGGKSRTTLRASRTLPQPR